MKIVNIDEIDIVAMPKPYENRFPWTLDWNLLRTFMVVVEQRGISRAAEFLGLKQPTISAALKRLEDTMGHQLIVRKPNEFNVTRAGKLLYGKCREVFGTVTQLPELMVADDSTLRGHISVSFTSHVVSRHFDDVLHQFVTRHPEVTFAFSVAESTEIVTRVSRGQVSLGGCLLPKKPANLTAAPLYREYFGLYCGPNHRLFHQKDIGLDDLAGERSVSFQTEAEDGALSAVAQLRARAELSAGWQGVSSNLPELRRMIMANIGIGALPVHVAARDVAAGRLRQLPPFNDLPAVDIYLLSNPRTNKSEAETVFLAELNKMMEEVPLSERTYT